MVYYDFLYDDLLAGNDDGGGGGGSTAFVYGYDHDLAISSSKPIKRRTSIRPPSLKCLVMQ